MPGTQNATNLAGSRAAWFQNRKATLEKNDARPEQGGGFQAWLQLAHGAPRPHGPQARGAPGPAAPGLAAAGPMAPRLVAASRIMVG